MPRSPAPSPSCLFPCPAPLPTFGSFAGSPGPPQHYCLLVAGHRHGARAGLDGSGAGRFRPVCIAKVEDIGHGAGVSTLPVRAQAGLLRGPTARPIDLGESQRSGGPESEAGGRRSLVAGNCARLSTCKGEGAMFFPLWASVSPYSTDNNG